MKAILKSVKVLGITSKKSQDGTKTYINLDVYSEGQVVKVSLQPEDMQKAPKVDSTANIEVEIRQYNGSISGLNFVGVSN